MTKVSKITKKNKIWICKVGSQIFHNGGLLLIKDWALQINQLQKKYNIDIVWVSSGAIAMGKSKIITFIKKDKISIQEKQALSAIGQPTIMDMYNLAFQSFGLTGAQILLSSDDLLIEDKKKNFLNTIRKLIHWKIIPIINENDAVSTEEIRFGDNDVLSSKIAIAIKADKLILLTNVDGILDKNKKNIPLINKKNYKNILNNISKQKSAMGSGGMYSKLLAAFSAATNGVDTHIVKGNYLESLIKIYKNEQIGTFIPKQN